jgi:hypothetical protein
MAILGITVSRFIDNLEKIISSEILECWPEFWDENHITQSLLKRLLQDLRQIELLGNHGRTKIVWRAWKLRGKVEENFGDLGILVTLYDRDGLVLQGAAFLEAKRKYKVSKEFDAIKMAQLNRILEHAPHAMLLIYDFEKIDHFNSYQFYRNHDAFCLGKSKLGDIFVKIIPVVQPPDPTHAATLPINIVQTLGRKDSSICRFASPFSHQLIFRFFNGFDLEFEREPIRIVKGWSERAPKFMLEVTVSRAKEKMSEKIVEINRKRFIPIDHIENSNFRHE